MIYANPFWTIFWALHVPFGVFVYWYGPVPKVFVYWYCWDWVIQLLVQVIIVYSGPDHFKLVRCGIDRIQSQ
jgi:hypothetical protein